MVPLAILQILVFLRAVGRSSTFVSVSSQSPLSIPIGFAAAALTAVLSPLPDDRSVQDLWHLSGHTIASLALVTRVCARLRLCVSRRHHPLRHRSERARHRCACSCSRQARPGRAGREAPPPRSGGLRWRHPTNFRVLLPCFRARDALVRGLGMQGWHVSHTARPRAAV